MTDSKNSMTSTSSSFLQRVKSLLFSPRQTLQALADAPCSAREALTGHLMLLALIPAVAQFIGSSVIGITLLGTTYRVPFFKGLVGMVLTYVLILAGAAILAFILKTLAPRFSGEPDFDRAMSLVAYSGTAAMVAAIFTAFPWLTLLATIGGIYSLYMFYVGIPLFMRSNPAKTLVYFLISVVLAFICNMALGLLAQPFSAQSLSEQHWRSQVESQLRHDKLAEGELSPEVAKTLEWLQGMQKHLTESQP